MLLALYANENGPNYRKLGGKKNNDYLSNGIRVNGVVFYFHFTFNFILHPKASHSKLET